jgi:hypothetical protein
MPYSAISAGAYAADALKRYGAAGQPAPLLGGCLLEFVCSHLFDRGLMARQSAEPAPG